MLFVASLEKHQVEELFKAHGWEGESSETVGLCLSPDNMKVCTARLLLAGTWGEEPVTIQAQKIWPAAAEHLVLEIALSEMDKFKFPDGEMASGYVAGATTKHAIKVTGQDGLTRAVEDACWAWEISVFRSYARWQNNPLV